VDAAGMNISSNSQLNPDDHITFRIKRKGKLLMGHPFSTPSYLGGGHGNEGGLPASEASPLAWLHALLSFPFALLSPGRGHQSSETCSAGLVRITTRSIWWLGDLVGKARGMHGEAETLQFSSF